MNIAQHVIHVLGFQACVDRVEQPGQKALARTPVHKQVYLYVFGQMVAYGTKEPFHAKPASDGPTLEMTHSNSPARISVGVFARGAYRAYHMLLRPQPALREQKRMLAHVPPPENGANSIIGAVAMRLAYLMIALYLKGHMTTVQEQILAIAASLGVRSAI